MKAKPALITKYKSVPLNPLFDLFAKQLGVHNGIVVSMKVWLETHAQSLHKNKQSLNVCIEGIFFY